MADTHRYADFDELTSDRPADRVRITLDAPRLNSVSAPAHRQLADVWRTIDRGPNTTWRCYRVRARGSSRAAAST